MYAHFMQNSTADCGIASLKTILKQLKINVSDVNDLYKNYDLKKDQGISLWELNQILINYGVESNSYEVSDFDQLKLVKKFPMVIVVENNSLAHYVVVHEIKNGKFIVSDPSEPNLKEYDEKHIKSVFLGFALCITNVGAVDPKSIGRQLEKKKKEKSLGQFLYHEVMHSLPTIVKFKMILLMFLKYMLPLISTIIIQSFMQVNNGVISIQSFLLPSILALLIIIVFYFINIEEAQQKVLIENKIQEKVLLEYYFQKINDINSGKNLENVTGYFWNLLNSVSGLLQKFYFKLNIAYALFLSIILSQFSILLTFTLLFWFFIFSIYLKREVPKIRYEEKNIIGKSSTFSYAVEDNIRTSLDINIFSKNSKSEHFVKEKMQDFFKSKTTRTKMEAEIFSTYQTIVTLMIISSFFILGFSSLKGDAADLINTSNSIFIISMIVGSLSPVVQTWLAYQRSTIAIDFIKSSEDYIVNYEKKEKEKLGVEKISSISIDKIKFGYEENQKIFKNFSATFKSGEVSIITGGNGSGKSTLVKIITGALQPESGNININNNISIKSLKDTDINEYISMYSTEFNIYGNTVGRNIRYKVFNEKLDDMDKKQYEDIFDLNLPNNYRLQSNAGNISQGQKQKILLMRALNQEKSIYIFDEPTGNLDQKSKEELMEKISKLAVEEKRIVILISHEKDIQTYADQVINIEGMRV